MLVTIPVWTRLVTTCSLENTVVVGTAIKVDITSSPGVFEGDITDEI